ncbi:MAG: hypothetical protein MUF14_00030 [Hyphomonadaceae bacterium]|nr:hypothetical protein [Hyphomonadaceae bacterium]
MKKRATIAAILAVATGTIGVLASSPVAAWTNTTSTTWIPIGQTFLLGGGQPNGFSLQGRNIGRADVEIYRIAADGTQTLLTVLEPQQFVRERFAAGEGAAAKNLSTSEQATLRVQFNAGAGSLGMRYRDN